MEMAPILTFVLGCWLSRWLKVIALLPISIVVFGSLAALAWILRATLGYFGVVTAIALLAMQIGYFAGMFIWPRVLVSDSKAPSLAAGRGRFWRLERR